MKAPPIVVINLKRRIDRWKSWVEEAEKKNIEGYSRWEAIDGRKIEITSEIEYLFRDNNFDWRRGRIGCALSHMNVWLHVVEKQIPALIVLEDDARFNAPFAVPDLPPQWDLFYFGGAPWEGVHTPGVIVSDDVIMPNFSPDMFFTAVGYMISFKGACRLLDRLQNIGFNRPLDISTLR